ncbi:Nn.00g025130.m01.CDS01 [Neocucurbitaria sp. VM-36]
MILLSLCLLSSFFACAVADLMESTIFITVPSTVEAGSPFNATINVQWHGLADSSYAHAFRIYLGSSYRDKRFYFYDSECYLIYEQSLCDPTIKIFSDYIGFYDTPITVTIPPSVGPSGKHYALIGRILNTDGSYYGSTWESDVFDLTGANGTWSDYQRNGYTVWGDDGMACTGFACVKECANSFGVGDNSWNTTYEDCANACPDVDIAFETSTYGGQPTAALTQPTACPDLPSATTPSSVATTSRTTGMPTTRSSTRTAAAAAATGGATSTLHLNVLSSVFASVVVAILLR